MSIDPSNCPCGSGKTFSGCCAPYLQGKPAPTAEALMRSRYTAHTLEDSPYLVDTTHPGQQSRIRQQDIYQNTGNTLWQKLEIVATEAGKSSDQTGMVEFRAWFKESLTGPEKVHHEHSSFIKKAGRWYFLYPDIPVANTAPAGRNDPCPCGSGKKYKKCCAQAI